MAHPDVEQAVAFVVGTVLDVAEEFGVAAGAAVNVSWDDGRAFCRWLTENERRASRIGPRDEYRLPTDLEWSAAVDLGKEIGATPAERDGRIADVFPWGKEWPPPKNVGNYDSELRKDDFDYTSPVGSFPANRHGLYDLGGNVWEWCDDNYDKAQDYRVLRGASWHSATPRTLLSSARLFNSPGHRIDIVGFRCVLDARRPSPVFANLEKGSTEPSATPAPAKAAEPETKADAPLPELNQAPSAPAPPPVPSPPPPRCPADTR